MEKQAIYKRSVSVLKKYLEKIAKARGVDWIGRITVFFSYLDGFN